MSLRASRLALALGLGAAVARAEEPSVEVVVRDDRLERSSRREPTAASTKLERAELQRPGAALIDLLAKEIGRASCRERV